MKNISGFIGILIAFCGFFQTTFAGDIPFTDIKTSDPYYYPLRDLFEGGIITDNGDHLFRPNDLMSRDFFVSLAVEIGCHECETPNIDDIIKYHISPFIDLTKSNNYYYCIAYAADNKITQGYTPNEQNKAYCENKQEYASSPFCAENTISRIEATAILLRRAKLWDDTMNQGTLDRSLSIPDTTVYWYGYAKKGVDVGILMPKTNGAIGQDEKITRGEFAIMAAKMLQYTQCSNPSDTNSVESSIQMLDSTKKNTNKSTFSLGEDFSLVPLTSTGNWNYNWILKNPITGEIITMSGNLIPGSKIPEGTWITTLQVIDPNSNKIVSESRTTITVGNKNNYTGDIGIKDGDGKLSDKNTFGTKETITLISTHDGGPWDQSWEAIDEKTGKIVTGQGKDLPGSKLGEGNWSIKLITKDPKTGDIVDTDKRQIRITDSPLPIANTNNNLSVHLSASPIVVNLGDIVKFNTSTNSTGGLIYKWNFGDGNTNTSSGGTNDHNYSTPGIYPVTVTVIDPKTGNTAQSTVIIRVTGNTDTDGDGIFDNDDACPYIYAKTITGCPIVNTYNPGNNGNNTNPGNPNNSSNNGFIAAQIGIVGSSGQAINSSTFNNGDIFNLVPVT
ncbi:S-layer homology domain-containing protein, partial [Candidatus Gracilibacteria bacterium]|nr:S-layer homology domain-containing protein [Candidatus Gracilibacteria bacterium]